MKCEECLLLLEEFVEDESDAQSSEDVEAHLAACPACAGASAELAEEQAIYSSYLLDVEASPALWGSLRAAIREEKAARSGGSLTALWRRLAPPPGLRRMASASGAPALVAASLLLAAAALFYALFYAQRFAPRDAGPAPVAVLTERTRAGATPADALKRETPAAAATSHGGAEAGGASGRERRARESRETYSPARRHDAATVRAPRDAATQRRAPSAAAQVPAVGPAHLLASERAYRQPIAELAGQIEKRGDGALPPALRAAYRRELAAVDEAIAAVREDALRHPDNPDLAEFLRAAYKGKLDLLASVAEQGEAAGPDRR